MATQGGFTMTLTAEQQERELREREQRRQEKREFFALSCYLAWVLGRRVAITAAILEANQLVPFAAWPHSLAYLVGPEISRYSVYIVAGLWGLMWSCGWQRPEVGLETVKETVDEIEEYAEKFRKSPPPNGSVHVHNENEKWEAVWGDGSDGVVRIGDGQAPWNSLPYAASGGTGGSGGGGGCGGGVMMIRAKLIEGTHSPIIQTDGRIDAEEVGEILQEVFKERVFDTEEIEKAIETAKSKRNECLWPPELMQELENVNWPAARMIPYQ